MTRAGIIVAVAGVTLGIVVSIWRPWGFAPAPGSVADHAQPRPGALLQAGEDVAIVPAVSVKHYGPPALALGVVVFVRGERHGRVPVAALCERDGGPLQIGEEPTTTWTPGGSRIDDYIGFALCGGHPLLLLDDGPLDARV